MILDYKLNRDQTVAVATGVYWNHDMTMCPRGVKVQLKSIGGVACYDSYKSGDNFWVAWAPVPRDVPQLKGEKNVTFPPIEEASAGSDAASADGHAAYTIELKLTDGAWGKASSELKAMMDPLTENSGGNVSYYLCPVSNPNQAAEPYVAECSDIIEALGMDFNEGEAFKAIWRKAAERTLGKKKAGNEARRDVEKAIHYGKRMLAVLTGKKV